MVNIMVFDVGGAVGCGYGWKRDIGTGTLFDRMEVLSGRFVSEKKITDEFSTAR